MRPLLVVPALFALSALVVLGLGCGDDTEAQVCDPGVQVSCACDDGKIGSTTCLADGSGYNDCLCPTK